MFACNRRLATALLSLSLVFSACAQPAQKADQKPVNKPPVDVRVIAFNDFHGNIEGPAGKVYVDGKPVEAGGVAYMKAYIDKMRAGHPNSIVVAAGDLIGASPLVSSVFHDEPTIEAMNELGLSMSVVGNHEFDDGWKELVRMQDGGCHPKTGCEDGTPFKGAKFHYLAANVIKKDGKTLFPGYEIKKFDGIPVAFIGVVLSDAPKVISPTAIEGLKFRPEPAVINALAAKLRKQGVEAIVVLLHQGGVPSKKHAGINECGDMKGPVVDIVKKTSPAVDVFITGHTHQTYICNIDGKLVTSALSYGRLLTEIDLKLDPTTHDVIKKQAVNKVVYDNKLAADAKEAALVKRYVDLSADVANKPVGSVVATLSREPNKAGESALGDVIADAQLAATSAPDKGGAQIAFMNPGGIRSSLVADKATANKPQTITFAQLHRTQPFGNNLMTMTLTGKQIHDLLEMQFGGDRPDILQVSRGFSYTWNPGNAPGDRVAMAAIKLNGQSIDPKGTYRVTVNSFLASGGDGFSILTKGTDRRAGEIDLDALARYFKQNAPVKPGPQNRIGVIE